MPPGVFPAEPMLGPRLPMVLAAPAATGRRSRSRWPRGWGGRRHARRRGWRRGPEGRSRPGWRLELPDLLLHPRGHFVRRRRRHGRAPGWGAELPGRRPRGRLEFPGRRHPFPSRGRELPGRGPALCRWRHDMGGLPGDPGRRLSSGRGHRPGGGGTSRGHRNPSGAASNGSRAPGVAPLGISWVSRGTLLGGRSTPGLANCRPTVAGFATRCA